ncbi:MAG: peptidase [Gemmatimonadetes bacterium]|nr:peptidase [Gemmatimonadota bacterium]
MLHSRWRRLASLGLAVVASAAPLLAQGRITSPKDHFGFAIGDDYRLATYTQFVDYWKKLDAESDRMAVQEIGKTAEGRPQLMAIVTSPENHRNLAKYKDIATKLARGEVSEAEAKQLAAEGKAVVWIDGGLHATEVLGAHQLIETNYRLVSSTDPEILRFLNDVIILMVHANPDGMELVSNWYMRKSDERQRSFGDIPRLYQKYVGHDNNRDFYMGAQPESENIMRVQYRDWYPQVIYNHHQTGPAGSVLFAPPFRAPHNHNIDPLVIYGVDLLGTSMHTRFAVENKPGAVRRDQAGYQTWWNGGLRTAPYFHNQLGLLTETIGSPTPMEIPFTPEKLIPQENYVFPITPQRWHFKQSIEYSVTANWAVLDVVSRHREQFLFNIWRMGRNAIEKGTKDTWTDYPRRIAAVTAEIQRNRQTQASDNSFMTTQGGGGGVQPSQFFASLRKPELRDPRGFIMPADQSDFGTVTKFVQALQKGGVIVHRAQSAFSAGGKQYPAGSYVVKSAQAFRAHVMDMFEPQDYPNDLQYPGGPPKAPYDNAGYTLAYQMGVQFDRMLDAFECPCEEIRGMATAPAGRVTAGNAGWIVDHAANDAFVAVNRVMKAGGEVSWMKAASTVAGRTYPAGAWFIANRAGARPIVDKVAADLGVNFDGVASRPTGDALRMKNIRVGLWDQYGGSMPSGWMRWIFEQFDFPNVRQVFAQELDAGSLNSKFDVLVFADGGIPESDRGAGGGFGGRQPQASEIPEEFRAHLGRVTIEKTIPQLKAFMENGGTVITIGGSSALAHHLGLPVQNHLVERTQSGADRPIPRERLFVPGSVLNAAVDNTHPVAHGLQKRVDLFFDNSPVFRLGADAAAKGVTPVVWFDSPSPLRSGWAWGQGYLNGGVAVAEAVVGKGRLYLMGPEVANRAQPHATFKLLFNAMYYGPAISAAVSGVVGMDR